MPPPLLFSQSFSTSSSAPRFGDRIGDDRPLDPIPTDLREAASSFRSQSFPSTSPASAWQGPGPQGPGPLERTLSFLSGAGRSAAADDRAVAISSGGNGSVPNMPADIRTAARSSGGNPQFRAPQGSDNSAWSFLGQGRADYEQVQSQQLAGLAAASVRQDFKPVTGPQFDMRRCGMSIFITSVLLILVWGSLVLLRQWTHSTHSKGAHRGDQSRDDRSGVLGTRHGYTADKGDGSDKDHVKTAGSTTTEPYDCAAAYADWEKDWSDNKKHWCCKNYKRGCISYQCEDWLSNRSWWSDKKKQWCCDNQNVGCGCYKSCWYKGVKASCRDRIIWSIQHSFSGQPDACTSAHKVVMEQCSNCSTCSLSATTCGVTTTTPVVPTTDSVTTTTPVTTTMASTTEAAISTTTGELSFDCDKDYDDWARSWTINKKAWCCKRRRKGCPVEETEPFDCNDGLTDWMHSWTEDKKHWCCDHHGRGCTASTTIARSTTTAVYDPGLDPYDCMAGLMNWKRAWTIGKKVWCCANRGRGCPMAGENADLR